MRLSPARRKEQLLVRLIAACDIGYAIFTLIVKVLWSMESFTLVANISRFSVLLGFFLPCAAIESTEHARIATSEMHINFFIYPPFLDESSQSSACSHSIFLHPLHGTHIQNVEPLPSSESTPTFPPNMLAISLQIDSPRPVPCTNEPSFSNLSKTRSFLSLGSPIPVSSTKMRSPLL